jgi:thiamine phosphate synthase YjbQ (UPF0047 family)
MPAHIKSSLLGNNLPTPIIDGTLGWVTWKALYWVNIKLELEIVNYCDYLWKIGF